VAIFAMVASRVAGGTSLLTTLTAIVRWPDVSTSSGMS
jgi:hypothetical protein